MTYLKFMELSLDESEDERGFAHGRLAQQNQLELRDAPGARGRRGAAPLARSSAAGHDADPVSQPSIKATRSSFDSTAKRPSFLCLGFGFLRMRHA